MADNSLQSQNSSTRLRAAMIIGSTGNPTVVPALIRQCAVEPDFFVGDMLTWSLTRMPESIVVPALIDELGSPTPQARSQALHTLSKIGDRSTGDAVLACVGDRDDEVARAAWRAIVAVVPAGSAAIAAKALGSQLGRGDEELRRSLSRAILDLGEPGTEMLDGMAAASASLAVREHIAQTYRLRDDPEFGSRAAIHEAQRRAALGRMD